MVLHFPSEMLASAPGSSRGIRRFSLCLSEAFISLNIFNAFFSLLKITTDKLIGSRNLPFLLINIFKMSSVNSQFREYCFVEKRGWGGVGGYDCLNKVL